MFDPAKPTSRVFLPAIVSGLLLYILPAQSQVPRLGRAVRCCRSSGRRPPGGSPARSSGTVLLSAVNGCGSPVGQYARG